MPLISLVGLPCSGKSTVGAELARVLGRPLLDSDAAVESAAKRSIREIFALSGEAEFRALEAAAIERLLGTDEAILATGGGAVLQAATRSLLRERTFCVHLHALPGDLVGRARRSAKRPLLVGADSLTTLQRLYAERDELYRQTAHVTIESASESARALAERVVAAYAASGRASVAPHSPRMN